MISPIEPYIRPQRIGGEWVVDVVALKREVDELLTGQGQAPRYESQAVSTPSQS